MADSTGSTKEADKVNQAPKKVDSQGNVTETNAPVVPEGQKGNDPTEQKGPTTPSMAIGWVNSTAVSVSNDTLLFVQDITEDLKNEISEVNNTITTELEDLRTQIEQEWQSLANDATKLFDDASRNVEDAVKSKSKVLQDVADEAQQYADQLQSTYDAIMSEIEYLQSIPSQFQSFLGDTVSNLTSQAQDFVKKLLP